MLGQDLGVDEQQQLQSIHGIFYSYLSTLPETLLINLVFGQPFNISVAPYQRSLLACVF